MPMDMMTERFLKNNYNYCYLKGRIEKAFESDCRNGKLIVGSSHALYGIQEKLLDEAVNCSMFSQDVFYDCLSVRACLENIDQI